ncbi:MAG: metalloregulator ArsR/SmtB family transcription factor [Corynebacterium sp.]|uniref:Transcriptional regulator, ArsR family n=1 Tax=Corynebacterium mustelae TaxID=571915 RepID=A0A0G3GZW6_9CORY|nr:MULTISPECIES: metalloregulator ArsR/SmtB family transcription factor [Corynebacterium]AKK06684.1 transcriptional regulator, ArsR family [Corynebacterium mustelae]MDO5099660.1 metalloregulator ArsR/SmtB family transcription factor [Corynebacterium sp.]
MPKEFEPQSLPYLQESIPIFDALKDEHRQNLLVTLVCQGRLNMTELAQSSTLSRTAVSHHVKILERVGLITVTKQGTTRFCEPNLEQVLRLLHSLATALDSDLAAARRHREDSPQ